VDNALDINRIAVVGAGQMGSGIAHICAANGFVTDLCDVDEARAGVARARIANSLESATRKGRLTPEAAAQALARIHTTALDEALTHADLVIEAVTEDPKLKASLFTRIDGAVRPGVIIASNTSSIPIASLAAHTQRPAQVIGMHFMNPVPVMQLVEVVVSAHTSAATRDTICALAQRLGKTVVLSQDRAGFIVNRVLIPLLIEACLALEEGVASAQDIDTGVRLGLNHPMGPLALADLIGLDTVLAIAEVMQQGLGNDKYAPPKILRDLVAAGNLGRKTGRGFYAYDVK
jgi:3-hydroxybutyryl-CoA dehydrogenase